MAHPNKDGICIRRIPNLAAETAASHFSHFLLPQLVSLVDDSTKLYRAHKILNSTQSTVTTETFQSNSAHVQLIPMRNSDPAARVVAFRARTMGRLPERLPEIPGGNQDTLLAARFLLINSRM